MFQYKLSLPKQVDTYFSHFIVLLLTTSTLRHVSTFPKFTLFGTVRSYISSNGKKEDRNLRYQAMLLVLGEKKNTSKKIFKNLKAESNTQNSCSPKSSIKIYHTR